MTDADLKRIYNESRDSYMKEMQQICSPEAPSATQESIRSFHTREVKTAVSSFSTKAKALGVDSKVIDKNKKQLTEELTKHDDEFFDLNTKKTERAIALGKEAFYKGIDNIAHGKLCVNNIDVDNVYAEGIEAMNKVFNAHRRKDFFGPDWDKHYLLDYCLAKNKELRLLNTFNNNLFGFEAAMGYFQDMISKCTGITIEEFNREHEKSRVKALEKFASKRNRPNRFANDILKFKVEQYIMIQYSDLKQYNTSKNKVLVKQSIAVYEQTALSVSSVLWQYCLHPEDLKKLHQDALCRALQTFRPKRACTDGFDDSEKEELDLHLLLENRYRAVADINTLSNEIAKEAGFIEFRHHFNTLANRNGNKWYSMSQAKRRECYDKAIVVGVETFYKKRRDRKNHATDSYKDAMIQKCIGYSQVQL